MMIEWANGSCCSCSVEDVDVMRFTDTVSKRDHAHCRICATTYAGTICTYALSGSVEGRYVIRVIVQVAHYLLKELKR